MEYIAIALAPGIAICLFIFYKDIYNREPKLNLIISFFLGCIAIFPAVLFEQGFGFTNNGTVAGVAVFSYAIVAFSEEFSKFLGIRLYSYNKKSFDEPLDGIVYCVMVGMGFATLENLMYVLKYAEMGQGLQVGIKRMFLSVPAHATFAVVMGYFVGKAKFDAKNSFWLMLAGLLGAVFFHGTFDFFLFVSSSTSWGKQFGEGILAAGALVSFVISLILSRKLIRQHRKISQQMFKDKNNDPIA
jgi:RsiW-degrading membrane proteinase PrsW (M82 family)